MIVLICDGDVEYDAATMVLINKAIINNIAIHTINVCDSASSILSEISEKTGGTYYVAKTSSEIASVMATLQQKTVSSIDMTDSDGDGLYDVYEVNGMKIQNGQIVKTDPNNADSDNDGVSDFDEIGCAPVAEVVKFLKSEYSCVIFKSKSNPWASDSDGDYYSDDIDEYPNKWNKSSIRDKYIDDTDSAKGKNPVESSYVYTNGVLTQITMGEGGTMKKNAYSFTRSNDSKYKHNGYSATFSLRPKKQSFYAITVTNVNNKADVDIKVTYVDEGIFKDKTIKVNQYSDATDDKDNHTATFYYLLEPDNDTAYTICINNNTDCDTYEVIISQDNWVYAKNGGKWEVTQYSNSSSFSSAFGGYLMSGQLYVPADRIISSIAYLYNYSVDVYRINGDNIEDQIRFIVNNSGMVDDITAGDIKGIASGVIGVTLLIVSGPGDGALAIFLNLSGTVLSVDGAITVLDKLSNYLERYGFERASREGNLNVYSTHYISAVMGNVWDAWDSNYYINKISINGDIGVVNDTITDEEIINWFGWKRP